MWSGGDGEMGVRKGMLDGGYTIYFYPRDPLKPSNNVYISTARDAGA